MSKNNTIKVLPAVKITVEVVGQGITEYNTDTAGTVTIADLTASLVSIVGERPMREERR